MKKFQINPKVLNLVMPENLRVGLLVAEFRKKCLLGGCSFDYSSFAFGQSPFPVPESLIRALGNEADKGHYSAAQGVTELRESIAGFNRRHFGMDVSLERVIIGPGTKDIIFTIFSMVSGHVIVPSPSWIGYFPQLKLLGKEYHTFYLNPDSDFKIEPGKLDEFLSKIPCRKEQHLLVLNNPHNPTGVVYRKEELIALAEVCKRHNTFVLADEIYALSTYNISDFVSMGAVYPEGTFVTNGLSKDRSAGGYRLGSCILPLGEDDELFTNFTKIAATIHTNVSTPTQYAAISVYEPNKEIDEYFEITRNIHRIMGIYMSKEFNKLEGINATTPKGSFYFYADFNELKDALRKKGVATANELGQSLLSHPHHVATVTGDAVMAKTDNYGARIAFVDYNGKKAFENFRKNPPKSTQEEVAFVKENAPNMIKGIDQLDRYIKWATG